MERIKNLLTNVLGIPLTIIAFFFIFKIFYDSREIVISSISTLNLPLFVIGILFFSSFFLLKSLAWLEILKKKGYEGGFREALFSYAYAETKRYIPGNIFGFAARIRNLSPHLSGQETTKSIGVEIALVVLSAAFISLPSIYYFAGKTLGFIHIPDTNFFTPVFLIFGVVFVTFLFRFPKFVKNYFSIFSLLSLSWFVFGLASLFIALSFSFINPENTVFVISYFVFAWLVGYLSFIAPMGLGVREVVTVVGLSFFVSLPMATIIALFSRLAMILGEIVFLLASWYFSKIKSSSFLLRYNPYHIVLFASILCFISYFTFFTFLRHATFHSGRFDLGNMSQTVWNTSRGHIFQYTNPDGTEILSRLSAHADFILILLSPLYYIWADPRTLLIVQTVVVAFGALYVYEIAITVLKKEKISIALAVSYLLNFWVQEQTVFDFHAVSLATTFLLGAFYYFLKDEKKSFWLFLLLAVITKENVFLIAALFGILFILKKKYLTGSVLFIASIGIFYILMTKLIPASRGTTHFALSYLSYLGDSTNSILKNIILKPQLVIERFLSPETLSYISRLLLPIGYLSFAAPVSLIFASPDFSINILSTNSNLRSSEYHYGALIIPFVYISAIYGIKVMLRRKIHSSLIFYYVIFASLISAYFYSPLPGSKKGDVAPFYGTNKEIYNYLSVIPENATVASSNNIAAHLSHRDYIYVVPNGMETADYVVFYNENPEVISKFNSMGYTLLTHDEGFYLYKRGVIFCKQCTP